MVYFYQFVPLHNLHCVSKKRPTFDWL